jgi:hypothetical protein
LWFEHEQLSLAGRARGMRSQSNMEMPYLQNFRGCPAQSQGDKGQAVRTRNRKANRSENERQGGRACFRLTNERCNIDRQSQAHEEPCKGLCKMLPCLLDASRAAEKRDTGIRDRLAPAHNRSLAHTKGNRPLGAGLTSPKDPQPVRDGRDPPSSIERALGRWDEWVVPGSGRPS